MDASEMQKLLATLEQLHAKDKEDTDGPWEIEQEPHNYNDGTTVFTHVVHTARDTSGAPMRIMIARHATPVLGELLVTTYNNLPEIIRLARLGMDHEGGRG